MSLITWEEVFGKLRHEIDMLNMMGESTVAALKESIRRCDEKDREIAKLKAEVEDLRDMMSGAGKEKEWEAYLGGYGAADA